MTFRQTITLGLGKGVQVLVLTVGCLITVFDDWAASDKGAVSILGWKRILYTDLTPQKDAQANLAHDPDLSENMLFGDFSCVARWFD